MSTSIARQRAKKPKRAIVVRSSGGEVMHVPVPRPFTPLAGNGRQRSGGHARLSARGPWRRPGIDPLANGPRRTTSAAGSAAYAQDAGCGPPRIVGQSGDAYIAQSADMRSRYVYRRNRFVSPHDLVEFVGPDGPVLQWPGRGERGAVESVESDMVRVVWERSPLLVAWPLDWVQPREPGRSS